MFDSDERWFETLPALVIGGPSDGALAFLTEVEGGIVTTINPLPDGYALVRLREGLHVALADGLTEEDACETLVMRANLLTINQEKLMTWKHSMRLARLGALPSFLDKEEVCDSVGA